MYFVSILLPAIYSEDSNIVKHWNINLETLNKISNESWKRLVWNMWNCEH